MAGADSAASLRRISGFCGAGTAACYWLAGHPLPTSRTPSPSLVIRIPPAAHRLSRGRMLFSVRDKNRLSSPARPMQIIDTWANAGGGRRREGGDGAGAPGQRPIFGQKTSNTRLQHGRSEDVIVHRRRVLPKYRRYPALQRAPRLAPMRPPILSRFELPPAALSLRRARSPAPSRSPEMVSSMPTGHSKKPAGATTDVLAGQPIRTLRAAFAASPRTAHTLLGHDDAGIGTRGSTMTPKRNPSPYRLSGCRCCTSHAAQQHLLHLRPPSSLAGGRCKS
jgi:hypothetical protein